MTTTPSATILSNAQSIAAGTPTASTNYGTLSVGFGGAVAGTIVNGSTAPTAPLTVALQISSDNTNWFTWGQATGGVAVSASYPFSFDIPVGVQYVRCYYSGNTGSAVTVSANCFFVATD